MLNYDWPTASYPLVILGLILAYVFDIPIALNTIAIASGALIASGSTDYTMIVLVMVGSVLGDSFGYYLGRHYKDKKVKNKFIKSIFAKLKSKKVHKLFDHYGMLSIFLTRWLFTPLGVPVNLISGLTKYPFRKFIIIDFLGEILWTTIYFMIGYTLGTNYDLLLSKLNGWPSIILALIMLLFVFIFYKKVWIKIK